MSQTSYTQDFGRALEGQECGVGARAAASRQAEGALDFGRVLVEGTAYPQAQLPSTASETVVGVAVRTAAYRDDAAATDVLDGEDVACLRQGEIYMYAEEAVASGDPVFFRHTANGAGKLILGRVRNDNDSSNCDQLAGARFIETTAAAGLVRVALNLP